MSTARADGESEGLQPMRSEIEQSNLHRGEDRSPRGLEPCLVQCERDFRPGIPRGQRLVDEVQNALLLLVGGEQLRQRFDPGDISTELADVQRRLTTSPVLTGFLR